jgi:ABC-type oligopeptide transport system substrate-binding subunit
MKTHEQMTMPPTEEVKMKPKEVKLQTYQIAKVKQQHYKMMRKIWKN